MNYKSVRIDANLYECAKKRAAVEGINSVTNMINIAVRKGLDNPVVNITPEKMSPEELQKAAFS